MQQTATSSPASARSTNLTHAVKRRDSLASSIGATSVRRLISVVRNSHNRPGPHYSRKIIIRYLIVFCISHLFLNTTFLPFIVLQGSVSLWTLPFYNYIPININIGSVLFTIMYSLAAASSLLSPYMIHKMGANIILVFSYGVFFLFYTIHLYPAVYLLVPAYIILGITLGQISLCYIALLIGLSSKMSCAMSDYDDDLRLARRTVIIRRFARAIQASQDLGLIFGSLIVAILVTYFKESTAIPSKATCEESIAPLNCSTCAQADPCTACPYVNVTNGALAKNCSVYNVVQTNVIEYNTFLDHIFDKDEHGHRLCGASACASHFIISSNTSELHYVPILPTTASVSLSIVFIMFSIFALLTATMGLGKLKTYVSQDAFDSLGFALALRAVKESFKDVKLQLSAPLAIFIGMQQAFIYSDFSKVIQKLKMLPIPKFLNALYCLIEMFQGLMTTLMREEKV